MACEVPVSIVLGANILRLVRYMPSVLVQVRLTNPVFPTMRCVGAGLYVRGVIVEFIASNQFTA